jgi:2-keto-4-pentenoate hydratase/2-oxohepta-3-ene-1,7-dioic acid hydratase in catechol pathway
MRLCSVHFNGIEQAGVVTPTGVVPVSVINRHLGKTWPENLFDMIGHGIELAILADAVNTPFRLGAQEVQYAPLYRHPRKILGIGLNYRDHAADLNAPYPTEPASFMKCDNTIIGPGDVIELPPQSDRVTAEAEIGVIIGKKCRRIAEPEARDFVAGYCLILDMTAEDILQKNPRFLTRAKNFDTFFSFGPELITPDEIPDVSRIKVGTWNNGQLHRENTVANMAFSPDYLVAFHSHVATLYPGDIISTGTPGAVVIRDGDKPECRIEGFGHLTNRVKKFSG